MSSVNSGSDLENISRPRDGGMGISGNLPFSVKQTSKVDHFNEIMQFIGEALQNDEVIDDRIIEHFANDVFGKSTTKEELKQALGIMGQLFESPEVLSEESQSQLMDLFPRITNHRNADYFVNQESEAILSGLSRQIPELASDKAQQKFFDIVASFATREPDKSWGAEIAGNIAEAAHEGINSISETARSSYISLMGNTAAKILSLSHEDQVQFQKAAIELMQKTQFPYKFDADSFREALFSVPENIRTNEYHAQLAVFGSSHIPHQTDADIPEATMPMVEPGSNSPVDEHESPDLFSETSPAHAVVNPQNTPEAQLPFIVLDVRNSQPHEAPEDENEPQANLAEQVDAETK